MAYRNIVIWAAILLGLLIVFNVANYGGSETSNTKMPYSKFVREVELGKIASVTIHGDQVVGETADGNKFKTTVPIYAEGIVEKMEQSNVEIKARSVTESQSPLVTLLINALPILIIIAIFIFFMRQMQSGAGRAMGFGKSKAKLMTEMQGRVTFEDVAGVDEAKEELSEIVEFLRDPSKFQRLGGKIPKGALLIGPPGTGKTLLARSIAGEANVPFFTISGSDFVEMFVGVGASRVRDMFEQAKKNAPCIIFIDEIDAVGRHRGSGMGNGNDEREQTLNQLLVEMDGFEANEGIILIAATNRPDVLDKALLRPGRFDRQIMVSYPDIEGRNKILHVHMKKVAVADNVDSKVIARGTPGFSGADLANLVNEAALLAARENKTKVSMVDFEEAKDKVLMGPERRSMIMSDKEKELTAYHEAGHAIVSLNMSACDPVHKATIIPRGRALGMVMSLPEQDRLSTTREEMVSNLAMAMGGRVAEEMKFGYEKVTTGAGQDIKMATNIARQMVTSHGLSDEIGPVDYSDNDDIYSPKRAMSPETARKIEQEVERLLDDAMTTARKILKEKEKDWEALAQGLLKYETLSGDEIDELLKGNPPDRPSDDEPDSSNSGEEVSEDDQKKTKAKKKKSSVPSTSSGGLSEA